ncbi:MAG: RagB/SusD family nutrient uptake outer membrane protein [Prevotella sp.]|jgi:hypothetical protein|nr:RagB/SusD family nutrient uptake outer membrane protein [Prevotella sp.]
MKKYILNILLAGLILSFSACSDMLDLTSPDQETSANFWKDTEAAEAGLATAYSQIESSNGGYYLGEVRFTVEPFREDIIVPGPDANGYPDWMQLANFTYDFSNTQLIVYWEDNYRGIMHANQVIEKVATIENIDPDYQKQIIAEATFLRGYYHLKLLLNWERIIIRDVYVTSENKLDKGVSPRTEAWDFILSDFDTASKILPQRQTPERLGRVTKGTANAYLGYAYLTRSYEEPDNKTEYLKKAEESFKQVQGYDLVKNPLSMFNGTNKNSEESIFEIQFTDNTAGGANYRHYLHKFIGCTQLDGWGCIRPSKMLLDEFKKEGKIATTGRYDTRAYKTLYFKDDYYNDSSTEMVYGYKFEDIFTDPNTEYIEFRKYLPATLEDLQRPSSAINVPLMRYADVLLLLAETLNEQNRPDQAVPLINQVRTRADMPDMTGTSQEEVRAQIEHERIVEFALECTRFYDLRRWGKTKEALSSVGRTNFDPAQHNFYPIPQGEINSNIVLREQLANEGN